ncbi:hypothetical protein HY439_02405 [Candidatus Microgenomates bacterium]|nr:hypothetical protein [Candidatus Microgenomates bacterium]
MNQRQRIQKLMKLLDLEAASLDHIKVIQEHGREIKRHLFKNIPRRGIPRLS